MGYSLRKMSSTWRWVNCISCIVKILANNRETVSKRQPHDDLLFRQVEQECFALVEAFLKLCYITSKGTGRKSRVIQAALSGWPHP
jgi:hypothetical protein